MRTTFTVKAKDGSVNAEGDIKINGSVNTGSTPDVAKTVSASIGLGSEAGESYTSSLTREDHAARFMCGPG